jgi:hypothetical protein
VRNCTGDEGRPFEVGNQVLVSSHRKLLSSKVMVVSIAAPIAIDHHDFRSLRTPIGGKSWPRSQEGGLPHGRAALGCTT